MYKPKYQFNLDQPVRFSFDIDYYEAPEWILEKIEEADFPKTDEEDNMIAIRMDIEIAFKSQMTYTDTDGKKGSMPYMAIDLHLIYYPPEGSHEDTREVDIEYLSPDDMNEFEEIWTSVYDACKKLFREQPYYKLEYFGDDI